MENLDLFFTIIVFARQTKKKNLFVQVGLSCISRVSRKNIFSRSQNIYAASCNTRQRTCGNLCSMSLEIKTSVVHPRFLHFRVYSF